MGCLIIVIGMILIANGDFCLGFFLIFLACAFGAHDVNRVDD